MQLGEATVDFIQMCVLHGVLLLLQDLLINEDTGRADHADSRPDGGGDQIGLQLAHLARGEGCDGAASTLER